MSYETDVLTPDELLWSIAAEAQVGLPGLDALCSPLRSVRFEALKLSFTLFWLPSKLPFEFLLCPAGQETVNYFGFGFCVRMF